ncbi:MAG: MocE family 2Fe-2S type ferredoxin [Acidobacteriota bacterium]|nr:MocE family 2Fe-2S type ferredoxin [Acidobacteriota bacterium]
MNDGWIRACDAGEIEMEDVIRFDYEDRTFVVYRTKDNRFYATDGLCTHGKVHLADGFVMDNIIECPKHNGQFDFTTGRAKRTPACVDLRIYPVKVEDDQVFIQIGNVENCSL